MANETEEKRADRRFQASYPARLHYEGKAYPCVAFDLSRSGVLLVGELPKPETPRVEVGIETPAGDINIRIKAQVAYFLASEEKLKTKLGLQFRELESAQSEIIESLVYRAIEGMAPAAIEALSKKAPAGEIRQALNNIPPPHRIMLARRGELKERTLLRSDSNPEVLEALARNPKITMPEILALAQVRHLAPSTVTLLAEDQRWTGNEELKILLATHPRVTFETAEKIVASLSEAAVQKLLRRSGLQPGVRQKLMAKLSRKSQ
jgi:hypothetical protein